MVHGVEQQAHSLSPCSGPDCLPSPPPYLTKATEAKEASSASVNAASAMDGSTIVAPQQQRRDPAGTEQLGRHHAFGIAGAT